MLDCCRVLPGMTLQLLSSSLLGNGSVMFSTVTLSNGRLLCDVLTNCIHSPNQFCSAVIGALLTPLIKKHPQIPTKRHLWLLTCLVQFPKSDIL